MDRVTYEIIIKHWTLGGVHYNILRKQPDYTPIAKYIIGNRDAKKHEQKWTTSRNLNKPEMTRPEPVKSKGEFRVPKGAIVLDRDTHDDNVLGRSEYVRYVLPEGGKTDAESRIERKSKD